MRMRALMVLAIGGIIAMSPGCATDPNRMAGPLFAETVQILNRMNTEADSYAEVFDLYQQAMSRVERLLSQYGESHIAMGLAMGQPILAGNTLPEFRDADSFFKLLAEAEQHPLACAAALATTIPDESERAWALYEIAGVYAANGQVETADDTILLIERPINRTWAWTRIAGQLAEKGQNHDAAQMLSQALATVQTVVFEDDRDEAMTLASIANALAEAERFDQALDMAGAMSRKSLRAGTLSHIAGQLAAAGRKSQADQVLAGALETARSVEDEVDRAWSLKEVARTTAVIGPSDRALEIVRSIARPESAVEALTDMAGYYARIGEAATAVQLLSLALETAGATPFDAPQDRAVALTAIAHTFAAAGQLDQALAVSESLGHPPMVLTEIAIQAIKTDRPDQAPLLLTRALEQAEILGPASAGADLIKPIATTYARLGQFDQALATARKASPGEHARALLEIADAAAGSGQYNRALQIAQDIASPDIQAAALVAIAGHMFATGRKQPAVELLSQALETTTMIEAPGSRAWVLTLVADTLARAGEQPRENQVSLLRDMVHSAYPLRVE